MKLGVFVDVSNLYYCVGKRFSEGAKLNYAKYLEHCMNLEEHKGVSYELYCAIAYGAQLQGEAEPFIRCLEHFGFECKFKKPKTYENKDKKGIIRKADWDVGIAMDIVRMIKKLDVVILGSADGDLTDLVLWIREQGVKVMVIACGISSDLRDTAHYNEEITEEFIEEQAQVAEQADA